MRIRWSSQGKQRCLLVTELRCISLRPSRQLSLGCPHRCLGALTACVLYLQGDVFQQSVLQHSLQLPVDLQRQVQSQPAVRWVWGIEGSHDASASAQLGFVNVRSLWWEGPWLFSQHIALDNSERGKKKPQKVSNMAVKMWPNLELDKTGEGIQYLSPLNILCNWHSPGNTDVVVFRGKQNNSGSTLLSHSYIVLWVTTTKESNKNLFCSFFLLFHPSVLLKPFFLLKAVYFASLLSAWEGGG